MDNMDGNKAYVPAMSAVAMGIIQVTMLEFLNIPSGKQVNGKKCIFKVPSQSEMSFTQRVILLIKISHGARLPNNCALSINIGILFHNHGP